ncbi:inorganic phosphate transporter [Aurantibacillus circumpalustris]|uniref:inorganic phosphate transporter n=1 Tax=Aurantibacillus circumpalustris TaxID=3036359 RepID=UPI00295C1EB9|nr:inorganic phosphate transporter [Aurantibacillus circumpalustris]
MFGLDTTLTVLLILCILLACFFEFINGFHDTANAVATVIYTNSMKPTVAVIYSGLLNFSGVMLGGIAVAMGIVNLLPMDTLVDSNPYHGIAMVLALLLSSIIWNFGTWYFGIPSSSSHTLIGSILGIGIAFYFLPGEVGASAVNWDKAKDTGAALLLSPLLGFSAAIIIMFVFKRLVTNEVIYKEPIPGKKPPIWIRMLLWLTCGMVSFFHGQNDGQKGVGLIMLILIAVLPAQFSVDSSINLQSTTGNINKIEALMIKADTSVLAAKEKKLHADLLLHAGHFKTITEGKFSTEEISLKDRFSLRKDVIKITKGADKMISGGNLALSLNEISELKKEIKATKKLVEFAPTWVIILISVCLGLGTMVGWKRIVKTVGEKIGKQHMSYAQGASAEIVASIGIGLASWKGLPVSTTHMLSSGIAGSMVAKKGLKNLQKGTVKTIALTWVLTLPVTIILSASLFLLFRAIL